MRILITGGTGTVGSALVSELLGSEHELLVLTRSEQKAAALPEGVTPVCGDLLDPATVRRVFDGVDSLFLLNATSPSECQEGLMAVNGARLAGVKRIVYASAMGLEGAAHIPHLGAKVAIETAVKESGISYTILRPNNFYQNDHWFKDALVEHGVYPQPFGNIGMSRVDVGDIAHAAALALTSTRGEGETFNLVGPEVLTGESSAAAWSEALGREIVYGGDDLDAFEAATLEWLPAVLVFDYRLMFAHFQAHGVRASDRDLERQYELIGREPRRFADFARETASVWLS
ncbi:MAG: SDR family oxidoreductase [Pyrinomonadaceae bacterium]